MKLGLITLLASSTLFTSALMAQEVKQADKLSITAQEKTAKWWVKRHHAKLEEKKALGDVKLVFLGDSITHAWEKKGKTVWAKNYAKYNALNLGYSGDRTEHVLWRLQNGEIDGISPKVIVMMIGTNNVGHRKEASEKTAAGIKAILDIIKTKQPQTKVLLLGIFPRGDKATHPMRKLNDATNKLISAYADGKSVQYLSINEKFLEKDGTLSKKVMPDLLHPASEQYQVWADAIAPSLKKLLGE